MSCFRSRIFWFCSFWILHWNIIWIFFIYTFTSRFLCCCCCSSSSSSSSCSCSCCFWWISSPSWVVWVSIWYSTTKVILLTLKIRFSHEKKNNLAWIITINNIIPFSSWCGRSWRCEKTLQRIKERIERRRFHNTRAFTCNERF